MPKNPLPKQKLRMLACRVGLFADANLPQEQVKNHIIIMDIWCLLHLFGFSGVFYNFFIIFLLFLLTILTNIMPIPFCSWLCLFLLVFPVEFHGSFILWLIRIRCVHLKWHRRFGYFNAFIYIGSKPIRDVKRNLSNAPTHVCAKVPD